MYTYLYFFLQNENLEITKFHFHNAHPYKIPLLVILPKEMYLEFTLSLKEKNAAMIMEWTMSLFI
jgi:hypothetical protein